MFRAIEPDPLDAGGVMAAVYPYLCNVDLAAGPAALESKDAERFAEALSPLHAPGAMFERCRTNSFMRPLQLLSCNGNGPVAQAHMENLRVLANLGRLARLLDRKLSS